MPGGRTARSSHAGACGRAAWPPGTDDHGNKERADLLDAVVRRDGERLRRQARLHSGPDQDAEDALSDACAAFLSGYAGEMAAEDARRWLMLVVRRCAWEIAGRRRRRARIAPTVPLECAEEVAEERRGPAERAQDGEETPRVVAALGCLKDEERRAILLLAWGLSYSEISGVEGWSPTKVNRRIAEGRSRLRALLREAGGERS